VQTTPDIDNDGGNDDGSGGGNDSSEAASIASPHRQLSDHRPGLRLELRSRLGPGLVSGRRPELGNRVERGGSLIFGVRTAIGLGPLGGERCDHGGDGPVFKIG
jgi:hypothetical protein